MLPGTVVRELHVQWKIVSDSYCFLETISTSVSCGRLSLTNATYGIFSSPWPSSVHVQWKIVSNNYYFLGTFSWPSCTVEDCQ